MKEKQAMSLELLKRNTLVWCGLFVLAFANGTIRELGIKRWVEEPWAHHLSALTAIAIFSIYVRLIWKRTGISTLANAIRVGALWLALTVLTETLVLNRWMAKLSWRQILESYDVTQGHLWPLVLLWVAALPVIAHACSRDARNCPTAGTK
jgi:hypothetical protein